jgi:polyisoprenyl-teichoic acid--peptidoglycan teichoic acid transferase
MREQPSHHPRRKSGLLAVILLVFAVLAPLTAYLVYTNARAFIAGWELTGLEGTVVRERPAQPAAGSPPPSSSTAAPASIPPLPNPWNGASRVTILILGLDHRDWESREGPPRSDTMLLLTVDPLSKTAGMLSVPRDLWVSIPGMRGYHKINTAYRFGELYNMPGGGPGLAMKTVEDLLGVPIDFYAQIDFSAFERFIDELGGVEVNVPEEIVVDPLGPGNTVRLEPGKQVLDGPVALAYARNRYTKDGDFDRARRQQQVVFAIRDQVMRLDALPSLAARAPALYQALGEGIHTNLTLEQAVQLAWLGQQIPRENIQSAVIGNKQVRYGTSPDGLAIFIPVRSQIRLLRDEIFAASFSSPAQAVGSPQELMQVEETRLRIVNHSRTPGLLERTAEYLEEQGSRVLELEQAQEQSTVTRIIDYTGSPYTLSYLSELMNLKPGQIKIEYEPDSEIDVLVLLGNDWAGANPFP